MAALAAGVVVLGLAGCSSAAEGSDAVASTPSASAPSPAAPSPGGPTPSALPALPDAEQTSPLPAGWPAGLPGYAGGTIISAVVSEDGLNVNAVWSTQATADEAWAEMDAALRAEGFVLSAEAGGEDMLVEDDTMRNDLYVKAGLEANVIVLDGEQVSVLLNASVLPTTG